jgi:23S rRNA pseudouridine1911/1915/1917 synthase
MAEGREILHNELMLDVVYEDAHVLAVVKPAGIATQAPVDRGPSFETQVRTYLNRQEPGSVFLGTVHRLDRPVSGIMVWAKTTKAARRLAEQFASREARKEYWAIVEGTPQSARGRWEDWLSADDTGIGIVQVCAPETPRSRRAVTRYECAQAAILPTDTTWLRLWPETGRTHQLRVQASSHGVPILGDTAYGATRTFAEGIALHAYSLTIRHPILDRPLALAALPPATWRLSGVSVELGR